MELPANFTEDSASQNAPASGSSSPYAGRTKFTGYSTTDTRAAATLTGKATTALASRSLAIEPAGQQIRNVDGIGMPASSEAESGALSKQDVPSDRGQALVEEPHATLLQGSSSIPTLNMGQGTEAITAPVAAGGLEIGSAAGNTASAEAGQAAAAKPDAGKPGLARGVQSSAQAAARLTHGGGAAEPLQHGNHSVVVQSAATSLDAAALARDPAGTRGTMNTAGGIAGGSTSTTAAATAQDTFAALDADTTAGATHWIHAGTQRAEAGFQDPALGWVGVRAEVGGTGIHAALVPGSADAAQALGGHLAGLNSYLAEQHTPVETLTLDASTDRGSQSGTGQGMQQGAGQNTGQGGNAESPASIPVSQPVVTSSASSEVMAQVSPLEESGMGAGLEGGRVSVMA
jgi:hypothetical protein